MRIKFLSFTSLLSLVSRNGVKSFVSPVGKSAPSCQGCFGTTEPTAAFVLSLHGRVLDCTRPRTISSSSSTTTTTTRLYERNEGNNAAVEGSGRGLILMGITLLACIWIFSIPPEYRRARICTTNNPYALVGNDCVTLGEWVDDVTNYYKGGGGVHFDFSIDQSTRDYWSAGTQS